MSSHGHFHRFLLPFKDQNGHYVTDSVQATQMLDKAKALIDGGSPGVMITYSANFGQTEKINGVYADVGSNNWDTNTTGANQAAVIAAMETLLRSTYNELQQTMRIAPITTMTYTRTSQRDTTGFRNQSHEHVVKRDLAFIKQQLENGWDVLGWINQATAPDFAVGGGVANGPDPDHAHQIRFPAALQTLVQSTLKGFETEFA